MTSRTVQLATERGVVGVGTVSLPGRGGSEGPPPTSLASAAATVAAALASMAPAGAVVLGHSMGGAVAMETVLGTQAPVRGLVLVSTGARLRVHPHVLARAAATAEEGGHLAELSAMSLRPDGPPTARTHLLTVEALTPGTAALADWAATDALDRLSDLAALDVPVLAVAGEVDWPTPPVYAEYLADHAPCAELVVLPAAGHWLPVEEAGPLADVVAAFVRRLGATAPTGS